MNIISGSTRISTVIIGAALSIIALVIVVPWVYIASHTVHAGMIDLSVPPCGPGYHEVAANTPFDGICVWTK